MRNTLVETLIGAVVLAVAGVFLFISYTTAGIRADGGYKFDVLFNRLDGVTVGTDVRIAGIKVGSVSSTMLDHTTFDAVATLQVYDDVEIPDDSIFRVKSDGLLGDSYIGVQIGGSELMIASGDTVYDGKGPIDLFELVAQFALGSGGDASKPVDETDGS